MRCTVLVASAGLMIGAAAVAKPLNQSWAPISAPWLVHIDLEAAMRSELGRQGLQGPDGLLTEISEDLRDELGFDVLAEVRSITMYGLTVKHHEPVVIISTTPATEAKLLAIAAEMGQAPFTEQDRTIYRMDADEAGHMHFGSFLATPDAQERVLVISPSVEMLHGALDLIQNKGRLEANLDQSALSRGPSAGSFLYVRASEIDRGLDIQPVALVLDRTEGVRVDMGESGGDVYAEVDILTTGDQEALQLMQIVQGGLAVAQLAAKHDPEIAEVAALATGVTATAKGREVALRFRHDAAQLAKQLARLHAEGMDKDGEVGDDADVEVFRHKIKVGEDGAIEE